MPAYVRRELLTAAQRAESLALPTDRLEIRERYSLTPADFDLINRHRTEANRLGFAIQLCLLRYPGRAWLPAEQLPSEMLRFIAGQIGAVNRQINRGSMGLERQDIDDRTGCLAFLEMTYQTLHQKHRRARVHSEQMVKESSISLSNRATVVEACRINQPVQPGKLIDCCGYNSSGRVVLLEIGGYEGRLGSQFQYFGDDFVAALCVTISENDCCRARTCSFKCNCSPQTLRRSRDE